MALAIEILFAAAVLLAAGLAAAGRIDGMSRAIPDAPPGLPEGEVTPEALREVTLPVVVRGYRMADVDEVLERAAAELEAARAAAGESLGKPKPTPYSNPTPYSPPNPYAAPMSHDPSAPPADAPETRSFDGGPFDDVVDG